MGFAGLDGLCKAETWGMGVGKVLERPSRMEAVFYASDGYQALQAMLHSEFELSTVGAFARVIWLGPFARKYVNDPAHGTPFLTSSTMMEARPRAAKLVSNKHTGHLPALRVFDGYILVSCSGTIGNVALCTKDVEGWACSQDAIRVVVNDPVDLGPVYCFMQSSLGQFLIERSQTGSVVRHIYEADVANLPIPRLPLALRQELSERVRKVSALRVEANRLLDEAERMVQEQLALAPIGVCEEEVGQGTANQGATVFTVQARERITAKSGYGQVRLDATSFHPAAERLRTHLLERGGVPLGDLLREVRNSNLRKRVYVEDHDCGVPLIGGKQLLMLRPSDLKYLSSVHTKGLGVERVREGWTLVSCGGTVGRVLFVHRNYNDWVMSQHVMRLIPHTGKVHPGFIAAFLSSVYGQIQLRQLSYGSVQKELRDFHFKDMMIALPSDAGLSIHKTVESAYDKRADARALEQGAFDLFMDVIRQGRQATESQWGQ